MKTAFQQKLRAERLWLALRLPDLPAQALGLAADANTALGITQTRSLCWVNPAGRAAGVQNGMDATTATLLSGCTLHQRDKDKEQRLLAALAEDLYQFSPHIEIYTSVHTPQSGLLLEISSCLNLFAGSQALANQIAAAIALRQLSLATGLAHTKTAAWLLSFAHYPIYGKENKTDFIARLKQLPIESLHEFPQQVAALAKTGFVTLADIARQIEAQSISSIKKRFGQEFAHYLCEVFDIEQNFEQQALFEKPLPLFEPDEFFNEKIEFDYPLYQSEQLQLPMTNLLQKLVLYLRKRQRQTQHIEWLLSDIYRQQETLNVFTDSPQSNEQLLLDLSLIQLENRALPFEIDTLTLRCRNTQPLQAHNQGLDFAPGRQINRQQFSVTAAKLKARLGENAIYTLNYQDSYLPQESNQRLSLKDQQEKMAKHKKETQKKPEDLPDIHYQGQRPSWLLDSPALVEERFNGLYWRGRITLLAGPERIQGNWWNEASARDYFIGLRQDQQRLWLFFDLHKQQWFVQGIFA